MAENTSASSIYELEDPSLLNPNQIIIQGCSTPIADCIGESIVPAPDISDVTFYTSGSSTSRRGRGGNPIARQRSASVPTPSISNLENLVAERPGSAIHLLSHEFDELSVHTEELNDSGTNEPAPKKFKGASKGPDWEVFKPKYKDRIFAKVVNEPLNTSDEAKKWLKLYIKNTAKAITDLMQFCIDVCGYQNLLVSVVFNYEAPNYIALRDHMQANPPKYQKSTGKYLMKTTTTWGKQTQTAIFEFVTNLLDTVYNSKRFFDGIFIKHLLAMVVFLVCSQNRSMHHTGVVLIAKMFTVFLEIEVDIERKVEKNSDDTVLLNNEQVISEVVKKVGDVLEEHFCVADPNLWKKEVTLLEEMFQWFETKPSLLITSKFFKRLMTCVEDKSKKVRSTALLVCHKILKEQGLVNYLEPSLELFAKTVYGRICDVDYGVATNAAYICADIIREYPDAMQAGRNQLMMLVYCENYQLAVAGGSVLNEILCMYSSNDGGENSTKFIQLLIKFSFLDTEEYIALLVEALLPDCSVLCDWNTMINLLLNDELEFKNQTQLIHIMSHAVQQSSTGQSKIPRTKIIQGHPRKNKLLQAWCTFLTNIHSLLRKFSTDLKSVQMLCEILLVIDYTENSLAIYLNEVILIIKILQELFIKNTDSNLLETITVILTKLCGNSSVFERKTGRLCNVLYETVVKSFVNSVDSLHQTETISEDIVSEIEFRSLKLSILLAHQDCAELIEQQIFNWFGLESIVTAKSMINILSCGLWYMIWTLRNLVQNATGTRPSEDLSEYVDQHKTVVMEYIKICFNFLSHSESFRIRTAAFECICRVYIMFTQETRDLWTTNPKFQELLPNVPVRDQLQQFMDFANRLFFEEKERSPLKTRRICLGHVLNMNLLDIIPIAELPKLYMHYELHKDDYCEIFKDALEKHQVASDYARAIILLKTVMYTYLNTDLTQNEAREGLRKLAKEFQVIVSKSDDEIKLILQMGINRAVSDISHFQLLYYLKYFVPRNSPISELMLTFLEEKIPSDSKDNPAFVDFKAYIQSNRRSKRGRLGRVADTSSNDTELESIIEEYDSDDLSSSNFETCTIEDDDLPDAV